MTQLYVIAGFGTAAFSLALAKTVNLKLHIIGVDISSEMLRKHTS